MNLFITSPFRQMLDFDPQATRQVQGVWRTGYGETFSEGVVA